MSDPEIGDLALPQQRGVHTAAALAKEQLRYAINIAGEVRPGNHDSELISGLVQAIATNYAATHKGSAP